jgi:5'-phosphate synthase pdxT subunit
VLDLDVARNAYGAQIESFEAELDVHHPALNERPLQALFIRAPLITRCGEGIEVLASHGEEPVVVRHGNIMAASFHPELSGETRLHRLWLDGLAAEARNSDSNQCISAQKDLS